MLCHIWNFECYGFLTYCLQLGGVLAVYSLLINCSFGHPTFWRVFKILTNRKTRSYKHAKQPITRRHHVATSQFGVARWKGDDVLIDDILLQVMHYSSAYDLSVMATVCRQWKSISNCPAIWSSLCNSLRTRLPERYHCVVFGENTASFVCYNSVTFHKLVKTIPRTMMTWNISQSDEGSCRLLVIIRREVYDLTEFASRHPGGLYILQEGVLAGNATRLFDVANHSSAARREARNYMIWSALPVVGKAGGLRVVWKK